MPSEVDMSAGESEADSPDPTPGVLRNWDEIPIEQQHSDWQPVGELEKEAELFTEAHEQNSREVLDVSSISTVPAGLRLPVRGAMLSAVGYPQKVAEPAMTWTNVLSATVAVSVGVVFLARSSHTS